MIIQIIIFGTVIMLTLMILFLGIIESGPLNEDTVQGSIQEEAYKIQDQSLMSYALHDEITLSDGEDEIEIPAFRAAQAYHQGGEGLGISIGEDELLETQEEHFEAEITANEGYTIAHEMDRGILNITSSERYTEFYAGVEGDEITGWEDYQRKIPKASGQIKATHWVGRQ